jgi:hypothetical protein
MAVPAEKGSGTATAFNRASAKGADSDGEVELALQSTGDGQG